MLLKRKTTHEINMTQGKLSKQLLSFALPFMLTGIIQLLFNAADMVVVGSFVGETALAAVGSTTSLVHLLVNLFIGLSVGTSVAVSRSYGAKDKEYASKVLHTSIWIGLIAGIAIGVIGIVVARPMLVLMDSPDSVIDMSVEYLTIYFIGSPFNLVYNFGAAVLRSMGDTKRPLVFLTIAGIMNVIVNLITVLCFNMGVAGVAYATITSQAVSAILVMITLIKNRGFISFKFKEFKIYKKALGEICKLGIPSGIQSSLFSLSNVIIQSTINSFGDQVMAANSAAQNLEGFLFTAGNAITNTLLTAVGQNRGAKNYERIKKSLQLCLIYVTVLGLISGGLEILLHKQLLGLYVSDQTTINIGLNRMLIMCLTYFLCGIMECFTFTLRGLGHSFKPMLIVLIGTCAFRIFWIYVIFPLNPVVTSIYWSYPISWLTTALVSMTTLFFVLKKVKKAFTTTQETTPLETEQGVN